MPIHPQARPDVASTGAHRSAFDVPRDVAYFNAASLAPQLHVVREAGNAALDRRSRPWDIAAADWFTDSERLRALAARLLDGDPDGIALVPATSYGFATAARNLPVPAGSTIVVLAGEYPSGVYTWRRHAAEHDATIATARTEPDQDWTDAVLATVDERTAIVSVPQVHWTDGAWVDLVAVGEKARAVGAALVVDASQSLGAVPFDVAAVQPDFVVSVGYKWLLGPFGRGYLWVAPRHRDGRPVEENWIVRDRADDFAALVEYRDGYQPGARRYDQGARTMFELTPMALASLEQVLDWSVPSIAARLAEVTGTIERRAGELGLPLPGRSRGPHMLGVPLPAGSAPRVLAALAERGCHAGVRGSSLRVSPHLHTDDADVDRLLDALTAAFA